MEEKNQRKEAKKRDIIFLFDDISLFWHLSAIKKFYYFSSQLLTNLSILIDTHQYQGNLIIFSLLRI